MQGGLSDGADSEKKKQHAIGLHINVHVNQNIWCIEEDIIRIINRSIDPKSSNNGNIIKTKQQFSNNLDNNNN